MTFYNLFQAFVICVGVALGLGPVIQSYRIIRRRSAGDVSLVFLGGLGAGMAVFLAWAIISRNLPLIISYAFAVVTYTTVSVIAFTYREPKDVPATRGGSAEAGRLQAEVGRLQSELSNSEAKRRALEEAALRDKHRG